MKIPLVAFAIRRTQSYSTLGILDLESAEYLKMASFVFLCNIATEKECLDRSLLGTPDGATFRMFHSKVAENDQLFLYNYESGQFNGPFRALTNCICNLVPDAFKASGIKAVWHVRVDRSGQYKTPLTADDLNDLGLLTVAPKIGMTPPAKLSEHQLQSILSALKQKNLQLNAE